VLSAISQNPFDFSNPVTDRSVLAGRAEEMHEATYYLDQSREGASYSLALIGDRASGKTSLLNALADYAADTGLIAAQIRLDEGFACDDLEFFREVFHSLLDAAADKGVFGGPAGAEYDTFCRQILTHDMDTSREEEALAFGRVYAKARASNQAMSLSRRMLLSDLGVVVDRCRAEGFPAVLLLIDEADVLASNHALLQTIRNLLMDSKHFSLVAAGTEQMFPAISEVFSPVPRQFVRVNVGPFSDWRDTRKAIQRRLVLAGQEWAMPDVEVCREIHSLTRGNPYEVMLVSHFAFRELTRIHQRLPMAITPQVIAGVTEQLEEQNPAVQETMSGLRELDRPEAETIRELIELDGIAIERFALARLDLSETYTKEQFDTARSEVLGVLEHLGRTGFVSVHDDKLKIEADSFQRALIKYVVLGHREGAERVNPVLSDPRRQIANRALGSLRGALTRELGPSDVENLVFELHRSQSTVSFSLAMEDRYQVEDYATQATVRIVSDGLWTGLFVFQSDSDEFREKVGEVLLAEVDRLRGLGVEIDEIEVTPLDREAIAEFQSTVSSESDPIEDLVIEAKEAFSEGRPDFQERVERASIAVLARDPQYDLENWQQLNDCAFMSLGAGASEAFGDLSARVEELPEPPILSQLTRALWEACNGHFNEAMEKLTIDKESWAALPGNLQENLMMYSPASLAREDGSINYGDLVGSVRLEDILTGYRLAVQARAAKKSVATALGGVEDAPPWLLGAAADAAEIEGRSDFAKKLRRRAADSLDARPSTE